MPADDVFGLPADGIICSVFKDMESFGDFLLQNAFHIWSPKDRKPKIMKKPQQLRVFLFETCLVFSKIVGTKGDPSDYATRSTYVFKYRMMVKRFLQGAGVTKSPVEKKTEDIDLEKNFVKNGRTEENFCRFEFIFLQLEINKKYTTIEKLFFI